MRLDHHCTETLDRPARRGVTLVEGLVSIGVLAMLLALLLPAIASSRRAAEVVQCRARMSQLGRAIHNFEARNQRYSDGIGDLSWHFELLPDLDRTDLFRRLQGHEEETVYLFDVLHGTSMPVLQCPSDPKVASWKFAINFLRNSGSMFYLYEGEAPHGVHSYRLRARDITDGLSMTAYVSEQMNEFRVSGTERRGFWTTPIHYSLPNQLDLFAGLCESMPSGTVGGSAHLGQLTMAFGNSRYDHIVRPNHASCRNGTSNNHHLAAFTANSLHVGGVHVLMADGAVRFVNDHVTCVVWRGMGTRNGHETITWP